MTRQLTTATAAMLALTMTAGWAAAQGGDGGRRRSGAREGVAVPRAEARGDARELNRGSDARDTRAGRGDRDERTSRSEQYSRNDQYDHNGRYDRGDRGGRYDRDDRNGGAYDAHRGTGWRGDGWRYGAPEYDRWRYSNRGPGWRGSYDRHAWRGRIRFGLGISIFAGTPFRFHFDYGWRPRFDYRYTMRPGFAYGGMAFLVDPDWTEVYIDGEYVGIARDFGGEPVPVAAGYHRIELYAPGFEPAAFDIHVLPGQVIPYRGGLYRGYW